MQTVSDSVVQTSSSAAIIASFQRISSNERLFASGIFDSNTK